MTDEYLDRSSLVARMKYYEEHTTEGSGEHYAYSTALREIRNAPAADVVEVVRCKDSKYFGRELENGKHGCTDFNLPYCRPDDFCSHGVQKEATSTDE